MKRDDEVIEILSNTNNSKYQLLKACEELSELTTALLQYVNKKGRKTTDQDVIDEIGDVKIRLKILENVFGKSKVKERYQKKLKKFSGYIDKGLYIGGI
tara:strand:- start:43293 stop:43589 length:297 start_codon:yes stop_codon:yes gene_type:complete